MSVRFKEPILHPEWMDDALEKLQQSIRLHQSGAIPGVIQAWMLVVPIMHVLRCIYGSDRLSIAAIQRHLEENEATIKQVDSHMTEFPDGCKESDCPICDVRRSHRRNAGSTQT